MAKKMEDEKKKEFFFPAGSFTTILGVSQSGLAKSNIFCF